MKKPALAATAHHEAGHAVAALLHHVRFHHVTIKHDADSAGHVLLAKIGPTLSLARMHRHGLIALAGEAAQRRYNPRSVRGHHGGGDREAVTTFAMRCASSVRVTQALVDLWLIQADEFVEMRWKEIARVAAALLDQETLTAADVRGLVLPSYANAPAPKHDSRTNGVPF